MISRYSVEIEIEHDEDNAPTRRDVRDLASVWLVGVGLDGEQEVVAIGSVVKHRPDLWRP